MDIKTCLYRQIKNNRVGSCLQIHALFSPKMLVARSNELDSSSKKNQHNPALRTISPLLDDAYRMAEKLAALVRLHLRSASPTAAATAEKNIHISTRTQAGHARSHRSRFLQNLRDGGTLTPRARLMPRDLCIKSA